ncbi:MAG: DUF3307 domain-containing protein [Bacteroidales bacterium]|nr:DUF3307 domain-containing protein [Bacteroidales bacterium]
MIALYQLLILQFTAHVLADFMLQGQRWSERKASGPFTRHHFWHTLIVFAVSYLLSFDPGFWIAALLIAFLHLGQDILKSAIKVRKAKNLFFTDQLIHLVILGAVSIGYNHHATYQMPFDMSLRTLAIASSIVICLKPANIIIKNILDVFDIEAPGEPSQNMTQEGREEDSRGLPNAGKLIGIVERLLAFVLVLFGQFSAVGLIIAAKSILRFRNTKHSEYVLVGTLLSFGIAIFLALIVSKL